MESEAERFGAAVGLDCVSTFECIVEGVSHFFMEMNTRIQVEHRVTELGYALRFTNPDDPERLLRRRRADRGDGAARAARRAPAASPSACRAAVSGVEVRINATNRALQPHAGGARSAAGRSRSPGEIRDDQGIGVTQSRHRLVHVLLARGRLRLEHRAAAHRRRQPPRQLRAHGRGPALHGAARRRPPDQPAGALRPDQLVPRQGRRWPSPTRASWRRTSPRSARSRSSRATSTSSSPSSELARGAAATTRRARCSRDKQTLLVRPIQRLLANAHVLGGFLGRFDGVLWTHARRASRSSPTTRCASCASSITTSTWRRTRTRRRRRRSGTTTRRSSAPREAFYAEVARRTGARAGRSSTRCSRARATRALADGDAALAARASPRTAATSSASSSCSLIPRIGVALGLLRGDRRRDAQGGRSRRASSTRRRRRSASRRSRRRRPRARTRSSRRWAAPTTRARRRTCRRS